jgi:hypothetical protein
MDNYAALADLDASRSRVRRWASGLIAWVIGVVVSGNARNVSFRPISWPMSSGSHRARMPAGLRSSTRRSGLGRGHPSDTESVCIH